MKVLIFGTGQYYRDYSSIIYANDEVVGLLDNNPDKWNTMIDGMKIYAPNNCIDMEYDKIILLSYHGIEMHKQMVSIGVPYDKLMYWNEYFAQIIPNECSLINMNNMPSYKKKVLIVTTDLNYNGGSLASIYMALALRQKGYWTVIATPKANDKLLKEYVDKGLSFIIRPALPYVENQNLNWISEYDIVIVNVLQMIQCACEISQVKSTIWWIHECSDKYVSIYPDIAYQFNKYFNNRCFEKIKILAVSNIAKINFQQYFPNKAVGIMSYGIPDERVNTYKVRNGKIVFAVIGVVTERKAQDIFIEAVNKLNYESAQYWVIGQKGSDDYSNKVDKMASSNPNIKFWGELTREQMKVIYEDIDVVVCPSKEETMSITITEGMMYCKTCIVSDNTGMAEYVDDGVNGFIFRSGDSNDLYTKMKWCIENMECLNDIGANARKTYEEYFTMEKFEERLEKWIID